MAKDLIQAWLLNLLVVPVLAKSASAGHQPYPEFRQAQNQFQAAIFEVLPSLDNERPFFKTPQTSSTNAEQSQLARQVKLKTRYERPPPTAIDGGDQCRVTERCIPTPEIHSLTRSFTT